MDKDIKKKGSKKYKAGLWLVLLSVLIAALAALAAGVYQGRIKLALKMAERYSVKGVDISYYQGDVDWQVLEDGLSFVYMKATEGSGHQDIRFEENLAGALETGLAVGAYHFFSFESSGKTQADHYIEVVGRWDGMLVPAVDVEYYSSYEGVIDVEAIREELQLLLDELEAYYGCKPVIYTTMTAYKTVIQGEFTEYPLWIRNIYYHPLFGGRNWVFWQYSDKGLLDGYSGEERYIDLDVFRGDEQDLENYRIYDSSEEE
ncbi:MAG: glycoside hydrolase family 25 [Lachnospiraceae bacterium]|nr:glycoside hydrolase family 25 [Lachnospiraceae bacterium]